MRERRELIRAFGVARDTVPIVVIVLNGCAPVTSPADAVSVTVQRRLGP